MSAGGPSPVARTRVEVVAGATLGLVAMVAITLASDPYPQQGLLQVIRNTARSSCGLFLLALSGPGFAALWPGRFTAWLSAHEAEWLVSFAISHVIHAAAIFTLAWITGGESLAGRGAIDFVGGGLIYLLILTLAWLALRSVTTLLGPLPRRLYTAGLVLLWVIFFHGFGHRALQSPTYAAMTALVALGLVVRVAGAWRLRRAGG